MRLVFVFLAAATLFTWCETLSAQETTTKPESLRVLIDQHASPIAGAKPALCTDSEFLRRVSLDLTGMVPTSDEARAFLSDKSSDKRERYIENLLASPYYARHMTETFDLMLMERRAYKSINADEWHGYLYESIRTNKPWNVLAKEILIADGDKASPRAAVRFYLDRAAEPHILTRDVGRIFFGKDLQCAQCHDHPLIDDYHQRDYHGLLAFMVTGYQLSRKEGKATKNYYAERSGDDLSFKSVFIKDIDHTTRARLIGGPPLVEPVYLPGEEYKVAPAANTISVPKFSRRVILAEQATNGSNDAFNRNIANRLWAHMMGRGLVHPVDLHHTSNPPSHPELLDALSAHFVATKFDVKSFLKEIATSNTYQRSIDLPGNLSSASANAAKILPTLVAKRDALKKTADEAQAAFDATAEVRDKAEAALLPVISEMAKARKAYADIKKKVDDAKKKLAPAAAKRVAKQKVADPVLAALKAAEAAAKALPNDKELAAAVAVLKKRSDALQKELDALKKAEAPLAKVVADQTKSLEPPKTLIATIEKKLDPLRKAVVDADQKAVGARQKMVRTATAVAKMYQQVGFVEKLAAFGSISERATAARAKSAELTTKLVELQKQLEIAKVELTKAQQVAGAAAATFAQLAAKAKSTDEKRNRSQESFDVVSKLAPSVSAAAKSLPTDKELAQVAASLQRKLATGKQQLDSTTKEAAATASAMKGAESAMIASRQLLQVAIAKHDPIAKQHSIVSAEASKAKQTLSLVEAQLNESVDFIANGWSSDFTISDLKALTPEQMCWTILKVSGVYDRYEKTEAAALTKSKPLSEAEQKDSAKLAARATEIERAAWKKLKGNLATFARIYGAAAGQPQGDFFATADQALYVGNGGTVVSWIAPSGSNVAARMIAEKDEKKIAEELYLAVLTRFPTEAESADVAAHLAGREDKPVAVQELIWGLITSVEFRFNH